MPQKPETLVNVQPAKLMSEEQSQQIQTSTEATTSVPPSPDMYQSLLSVLENTLEVAGPPGALLVLVFGTACFLDWYSRQIRK